MEKEDNNTILKDRTEEEFKEPSMYNVIFYNDDYTPMGFVVDVLQQFFHKAPSEASAIMMEVHKKGKGLAGVYTYDIASSKQYQSIQNARIKGYPLKVELEEA